MPNYQLGKIYKIESNQCEQVYVGSTCEKYLSNRLSGHKTQYKGYMIGKYMRYLTSYELLKYNDAKIYLIEDFPCDRKEQLHAREGYWIKELDCINKRIAGRTQKQYNQDNKEKINSQIKKWREDNKDKIREQQKKYYQDNKEEIREKNKQYREENKEEIREKKKQYREENKDKIKAHRSQKVNCECGTLVTLSNLNRHRKSVKHKKYIQSLE